VEGAQIVRVAADVHLALGDADAIVCLARITPLANRLLSARQESRANRRGRSWGWGRRGAALALLALPLDAAGVAVVVTVASPAVGWCEGVVAPLPHLAGAVAAAVALAIIRALGGGVPVQVVVHGVLRKATSSSTCGLAREKRGGRGGRGGGTAVPLRKTGCVGRSSMMRRCAEVDVGGCVGG
jgi:hypothetical protein